MDSSLRVLGHLVLSANGSHSADLSVTQWVALIGILKSIYRQIGKYTSALLEIATLVITITSIQKDFASLHKYYKYEWSRSEKSHIHYPNKRVSTPTITMDEKKIATPTTDLSEHASINNASHDEGVIEIPVERETVKRKLKSRHMQFYAIGGTIGTGLFVGIGGGLAQAGPLSLLLGYSITSIFIFSMVSDVYYVHRFYDGGASTFTYTAK